VTNSAAASSGSVVWSGRPWILPSALARTIIALIVASVFVWLEYFSGTAGDLIVGFPVLVWTVVVFLIIWLLGLTGLLVERATNLYTLKTDSLEIRTGIFTSRSLVIVASGFSDLEVIRGVVGRIIEYGDIIVRTQSERNPERTMIKVRDPLKVAEQIRYVMGRPIVRLENQTDLSPRP
jgi:membrane protein YdbS with pleckstrin-like domain